MSAESGLSSKRSATIPLANPSNVPRAPPLPTTKTFQRAREAANRIFGYQSRPPSAENDIFGDGRYTRGSISIRHASISASENATASHKTGLAIKTLSINERGTHALIGGKEIFKTVRIEAGENGAKCIEELNLKTAIKSAPTQASGAPRSVYSIDIADVAWAKGDCGDLVAAATSSGKIILYDLGHAGLPAAQLYEHSRQVHKVTFNPHRGNLLLSGSQDGTVRLWDLRDIRREASKMQSKRKYSGQSDGVRDVKWSLTDGVDFAFGTDGGWIQRWDIRNLKQAKVRIPAHAQTCNAIDWHPDGKHLLSASADKTVKVWDVSSTKPRKALWEVPTPYSVSNARWRPSCESYMPGDDGARLCTQFVAAYDREHPVIHVWDLRRSALPFRELSPHQTAPTDLLWHSQDLLWTVGSEGTFWQTDIQYAPKVIDKRSLAAVAVSPRGDLDLAAQRRRHRKMPKKAFTVSQPLFDASRLSNKSNPSPESTFLSRSWADDSLDQSFLSTMNIPRRLSRHSSQSSNVRAPSINGPSSVQDGGITIKLDDVLLNRKSKRPHQATTRGTLPGVLDPTLFRYLAQRYTLRLRFENPDDLSEQLQAAVAHQSSTAHKAGFYRQAQMWKIVGFAMFAHLKSRAARRDQQNVPRTNKHKQERRHDNISKTVSKLLTAVSKSPIQSPASARPVSNLTQQLLAPETSSNQPTPQARPIKIPLPDVEKSESFVLPPSATSHSKRDDAHMEPPVASRRLTNSNLDLHKLEASNSGTNRIDMVKQWNTQQRSRFSFDPADARGISQLPRLEKQDSDDSFQFLVESTASRDPSIPSSFVSTDADVMPMPAERLMRVPIPHVRLSDGQLADIQESHPASNGAHTEVTARSETGLKAEQQLPSGQTNQLNGTMESRNENDRAHRKVMQARQASAVHAQYISRDDDTDIEEGAAFTMVALLRETLQYYTQQLPSAQVLVHLLLLLEPLLPRTQSLGNETSERVIAAYLDTFATLGYSDDELPHLLQNSFGHTIKAGLNPLQIESILSTYHEQLMQLNCFTEAAMLRRCAYPAYPAVYEDALKDSFVGLKCSHCGKVIESGDTQLRCANCSHQQQACVICDGVTSPFEISNRSSNQNALDRNSQHGRLLSVCLLCSHGGHIACLREWFAGAGAGDGGCAAEGCLCDCTVGSWRTEKTKLLSSRRPVRSPSRVRSDEWKAKESKAAHRATSALQKGVAKQKLSPRS